MPLSEKLLQYNKSWVQDKLQLDANYFDALSADQNPDYMWIGCSDSRVMVNEVTGAGVGEMFVHRNIANMVIADDLNILSVLQYAVEVLKVRHVIVCGHYECGGIRAAMSSQKLGLIDQWLDHIRAVQAEHQPELDAIADDRARFDRLVELNVHAQIMNLANTDSVRRMWASHQMPSLHGWVLDLRSGLLKEIITLNPPGGTNENPFPIVQQ